MVDSDCDLPWWRHDRPWGFRFSPFDAVVLAAGAVVTVAGFVYFSPLGILVPFLLGHFLLFCNTFRIGGERSLLWIAGFFVNVGLWTWSGEFPWTYIVLTQLPITALLIGSTLLGRNYHGIACRRINPHGYRTGAKSEGAFTRRVLRGLGVPPRAIEVLTGREPAEP
jgi:hypothetical protein